tara:strand:- start:311 stop:604 length:294 start_codon:yes stop_codon:yes gene_type:complete
LLGWRIFRRHWRAEPTPLAADHNVIVVTVLKLASHRNTSDWLIFAKLCLIASLLNQFSNTAAPVAMPSLNQDLSKPPSSQLMSLVAISALLDGFNAE